LIPEDTDVTRKIIQQLTSIAGLKIECPNCNEEFAVKRARLFGMYDSYPATAQKIIQQRLESANELIDELRERAAHLDESKKSKPEKISISAQATNFGQISEQILPAFLTFPYKQEECRILFKPIDYVIFSGLSRRGRIDKINFVELKTGGGQLNRKQRQIRDRVAEGKIKHRIIGQ